MALIHEYLVTLARRLRPGNDITFLDYGCGAGEVVRMAQQVGFDAYGVDLFYAGGSYRGEAERAGLLGSRVFELENGIIPFPEERFDVVVSNQVFEHIDDFTDPVLEVNRILKPQGLFINLFPTNEVWREGHIGIPFAHWFAKGSSLRHWYSLGLRFLGVGFNKQGMTARRWTAVNLAWIDDWTFYKPLSVVIDCFEPYFHVEEYAGDYFSYRLGRHPRLNRLAFLFRHGRMNGVAGFLCRHLSGHVFVLKKLDVVA